MSITPKVAISMLGIIILAMNCQVLFQYSSHELIINNSHHISSSNHETSINSSIFSLAKVKSLTSTQSPRDQSISSSSFQGPLPSFLNTSSNQVKVPMYYSASHHYHLSLFSAHTLQVNTPVNMTVQARNNPILYGFDFGRLNSSLQVDNTSLVASGANASSDYFYNQSNPEPFDFFATGSGGSTWSNFSISSSSNQALLNPFTAPLLFNMSYEVLNALLPNDGLLYTLYLDFKFDVNSSLVQSPFPSTFRIFLQYSPNYAAQSLYNVQNNPNLWFYVNTNSNIDVLVKNPSLNNLNHLSLNISNVFWQITHDLNITSVIPYFSTFKGVEFGFFSTNSTSYRQIALHVQQFSLYNSFTPSQWLTIHATASSFNQQVSIGNNLFSNQITLNNCSLVNIQFNFSSGVSIDPALFLDQDYIVFLVNISFLQINFFKLSFDQAGHLHWSASIHNFPLYYLDSNITSSNLIYSSKTLLWLIDRSWSPVSLPSTSNKAYSLVIPNTLLAFTITSQSKFWFGGQLDPNFSATSFTVSFQSSNKFSPFTIQGTIYDESISLQFINPYNLQLSSNTRLFTNKSNQISPYTGQLISQSNNTVLTLSLPLSSINSSNTQFLITLRSSDITDGLLLQSFTLNNLIEQYDSNFTCFYHNDNSTIENSSSFIVTLSCSLNSLFFSNHFLRSMLFQVSLPNVSYIFNFQKFSSTYNNMSVTEQIFIPTTGPYENASVSVSYKVFSPSDPSKIYFQTNSSIFYPFTDKNTSKIIFNNQNTIYSSWPFYGIFSIIIIFLIQFKRKKSKAIIKDQLG